MSIFALFGREAVEDLEMRFAAGGDAREIDREIERLGIDHQISTRLTSWVAVSEEQTVDPGDPLRRERMPHELPYGMSAEGLGLRAPMAPMAYAAAGRAMPTGAPAPMYRRAAVPPPPGMAPPPPAKPMAQPPQSFADSFSAPERGASFEADDAPAEAEESKGRGLIGAIKDFFGGRSDDEERAPAREEKKKEATSRPVSKVVEARSSIREAKPVTLDEGTDGATALPRKLRGRITLHRAGLLVIEIVADGAPLDWAPGNEARIALVSSRVFTATLDAGRTTRAGTVAAGATARLALILPPEAPLDAVLNVTIELDGDIVLIQV